MVEEYYLNQENTKANLSFLCSQLRNELFKKEPKRKQITEVKCDDVFVIAEQYKMPSAEAFLVYRVTGDSYSKSPTTGDVFGKIVDLSLELKTSNLDLIITTQNIFKEIPSAKKEIKNESSFQYVSSERTPSGYHLF
jgi:hypothetical protein